MLIVFLAPQCVLRMDYFIIFLPGKEAANAACGKGRERVVDVSTLKKGRGWKAGLSSDGLYPVWHSLRWAGPT